MYIKIRNTERVFHLRTITREPRVICKHIRKLHNTAKSFLPYYPFRDALSGFLNCVSLIASIIKYKRSKGGSRMWGAISQSYAACNLRTTETQDFNVTK